ncbi:MAG: ComF family protein [Clostridia bacterium]|nr:ComF family protein [Clostridia bacterium]
MARFEPFDTVIKIGDIDGMTAAFVYDGVIKQAIMNFKYNGRKYIAKPLALFMEADDRWNIDFVTFVPITQNRRLKRGYNQSEELARHFCDRTGLQLRGNILTKVRDTDSQTKLTREERRANLKGAFKATQRVNGFSVLLIDDVITTGSTALECAHTLKRAGAKRVYVLAVAASEKNLT